MSVQSWLDEFYPVDIEEFELSKQIENPIKCMEHSILKWSGLLPSNLKKHKVFIDTFGRIKDRVSKDHFFFSGKNCALCVHVEVYEKDSCEGCPIYEAIGDTCNKQFIKFIETGNYKPMRRLLNNTYKKMLKDK